MDEKSLKIYKSLFYLNLNSLKNLIREEKDLHLTFTIPEDINYPEYEEKLTVFDILRMKIDIWARVNINEDLKLLTGFLSENMYKKALECKEYLDAKFPDFNADFEYVKHRNLLLDFYADKNYIGEESYNNFINQGFESLDLDLFNAVIARNEVLVISLLKNGASPKINIANSDKSINLLDYLEIFESTAFMIYSRILMDDFNSYKYNDLFKSLSDLYAAASTAKMLLLIDLYKVSD